MAQVQRSVVTLRITGDGLVPDEVTRLLGCSPTSAQTKGQVLVGRNTGTSTIARAGMWRLKSLPREPEDIDGHIAEILGKLSGDLDVWKEMTRQYKIDLFCGLFMSGGNEGLTISPQSLAALGARGIELALDIYGPDDAEDA